MASYNDPYNPPDSTGWVWSDPLGQWIRPPVATVPNPMWSNQFGTWETNPAVAGTTQPQTTGGGTQQALPGYGIPGFETNPMAALRRM